jgi:hypothetical protein
MNLSLEPRFDMSTKAEERVILKKSQPDEK